MTSFVWNNPVHITRTALLDWCEQQAETKVEKWGEGETFEKLVADIKEASKDLPIQSVKLYCRWFRFGFTLSYMEKPDQGNYIPLPIRETAIVRCLVNETKPTVTKSSSLHPMWSIETTDEVQIWWPIWNPDTHTFFLPRVSVQQIPPQFGSMPTTQYLGELARYPSSSAVRILRAMGPYSEILQKEDPYTYAKISKYVANWPPSYTPAVASPV